MATIRGTTPIITLTIEGEHIGIRDSVFVTLDQDGTQITKTNDDLIITELLDDNEEQVGTEIMLELTQADTLLFETGNVEVQVRWVDTDSNEAYATSISNFKLSRVLLEKVIV